MSSNNVQIEQHDIFVNSIFKISKLFDETICKTISDFVLNNKQNIGNIEGLGTGDFKISHSKNDNYKNFSQGDDFLNYIDQSLNLNLKETLLSIAQTCGKAIGFDNLKMSNSWVTIQDKGSLLCRHYHYPSKISGVCYFNVSPEGPPICFYNPNPFIETYKYDNISNKNVSNFSIVPTNGDVILFPSYLNHDSNYKINNIDNRVALSFNTI